MVMLSFIMARAGEEDGAGEEEYGAGEEDGKEGKAPRRRPVMGMR